jgi:hypothetical protein
LKLKEVNNISWIVLLFIALVSTQSCKTEYEKVVESELSSGVVYDSLIHDLKIGLTKKEFYKHCWALNKSKAITAGSGNKYALFVIPVDTLDEHQDKINVEFYGIFDEAEVMQGMEMKMEYYSWAPWLEQFHSDKLMERIQRKMMEDYPGNDFMEIAIGDIIALVKVDGNRQIRMYPLSEKQIMVKIEDLRAKNL